MFICTIFQQFFCYLLKEQLISFNLYYLTLNHCNWWFYCNKQSFNFNTSFLLFTQIPDGVNVSKEARLAISKAASVFVLYATSCSNNYAMKAKRKTINANDVISAMEEMEFDQFEDPLKHCLEGIDSNCVTHVLSRREWLSLCLPMLYLECVMVLFI